MDFIIIGLVALGASGLTFFSGFGLGTLLLPAFALFFPAPITLAATGVVHLLNNLFKGTLVRKMVDWQIVWKFGLPAIPAAVFGAFLLTYVSSKLASIIIGIILMVFVCLEIQPWFQRLAFPRKYIPLGGALTGLMGGLSGQQGALRSMFLLKSNLDTTKFIATGILIAVLIDLARIPTYFVGLSKVSGTIGAHELKLIMWGTLCAFVGAWLGAKYMRKTRIVVVRYLVAGLMFVIGLLLVFGVIGS